MLQSPVATLVAVLALALGIGVNISAFIAVNAMILHPFPFPRLDRIMAVSEAVMKSSEKRDFMSPANFLDWKKQTRSFEEVAAYRGWAASITGNKESATVHATQVTAGFFRVLGMNPIIGRTFAAEEDQENGSRPVLVSEGFWQQHWGGARDVKGQRISLNGASYTVVGVMPAEFDFPLGNQIWAPLILGQHEKSERNERSLQVVGLLKPDAAPKQAGAEANEIARGLEQQYPGTNQGRGIRAELLLDATNEVTSKFLCLLLGAATMVLLLACANVTNLQLARAARREKEIAVRAALGASRFQIGRQLAAESVLMALAGGMCAIFLASWNLDVNKSQIPAEAFEYVPGLRTMQIDSAVIAYALGISVVAGLLACLPALFRLLRQRSLTGLSEALQTGGRVSDSAASVGRNRLQAGLIAFEVAMAMVLLVGATLMVKGFKGLLTGQYGYEAKNILRLQVSLPAVKYAPGAPVVQFYDRTLTQLRGLPGVQAASVWTDGPDASVTVAGRPAAKADEVRPEVEAVGSEFLKSMHMPLLQGRFFSEHDRPDSLRVAVISAVVAREYWPHSNPIGQRIKLGNVDSPWVTVVGVSGDMVRNWLTNHPAPLIYVPYTQAPIGLTTFVVRTVGEPQQLARAAQDKVHEIDKDLPIYEVGTMDRYLYHQMSGVRAAANTMRTYSLTALMLAATGIFGVISFFVAQRTRDIGVHMALGASTKNVLEMTLGQTLGSEPRWNCDWAGGGVLFIKSDG